MIFVTIGSQEPFDRLIEAVDSLASSIDTEIIAQVFRSNYKVKNIKTVEFISPIEYNEYIQWADMIIAHAGMGTILSVLQLQKPLIVVPRLAKYHETRNNHQVATAIQFEKMGYVKVAYEAAALKDQVLSCLNNKVLPEQISTSASPQLIGSIKTFIHNVALKPS
jgi:UDP-N-acetylglucosamine transferase subunit ALG13